MVTSVNQAITNVTLANGLEKGITFVNGETPFPSRRRRGQPTQAEAGARRAALRRHKRRQEQGVWAGAGRASGGGWGRDLKRDAPMKKELPLFIGLHFLSNAFQSGLLDIRMC